MGTESIKIAQLDVNELVSHLNKAYCDEWIAFYLYWYLGKTVSGFGYEDMSEFLIKTAEQEYEHAGELAERIIQLGGLPTAQISMIERNANVRYPQLPKNTDDYSGIIDVVLKSEAGAIDVYERLAGETMGKDHVTYQLMIHILAEEAEHEDRFESLKSSGAKIPVEKEFASVGKK